ncbi:lasso peptide biosynthesis PqqD family chaperone [Kitasatospora sp. NPDC048722]|uniref:lasso peptide biosynthesis PqqD family chaperone n=1 Tax=Kitasatospora sp. NPDC048722 TaxID=3155639 RepID=UPI0033F17420
MAVELSPDVTLTPTGSGAVVLDERSGRYFQLNRTGLHILRSLLDGRTAEEIATDLSERYPVTAAQVHTDIDTLRDSLRTAGLVTG